MADAAREAAKQGRMEEAQKQKRMSELERMLDHLRNARAESGKSAQQRQQQSDRHRCGS